MEDKEKLLSLISITHSFFKLDFLLFLLIYPYKLPGLTSIIYFRYVNSESAHNNGVKLVTFYPIIKSIFTYLKYMMKVKGQSR